ncbi:hypothetical protein Gotri_000725, partial [Gossypium trilobum]|nr:hypothetical protein [Gossypium trilobum]
PTYLILRISSLSLPPPPSVTGLDLSTPSRHQIEERKRFMLKRRTTENNRKSAHKLFE